MAGKYKTRTPVSGMCLNMQGSILPAFIIGTKKKVQVGKDQEKAQSEKDSHSKNQGGKNQTNNQVLIP